MSFASLRVRLLVAAAISIILALALAAAGLAWLFERHVERWIDSGLEVELNQLVGGLRRSPTGQIEIGKMPSDPRFEQPLSGLYWQVAIEPSGPVLRSRSLWDFQLALPDAKVDDALHQSRLPGPGGSTLLRPSDGMSNFPRRWAAARPRLPSPLTPASCARPFGASLGR